MNAYDKAHELSKALKDSDEYRRLLVSKHQIDGDAQAKKMVEDFLTKRLEIETEIMMGKSEDKAKVEQLQKMYEVLALNSRARDFLDNYMRFNQLMSDIYKIIGETVSEGMNMFAK